MELRSLFLPYIAGLLVTACAAEGGDERTAPADGGDGGAGHADGSMPSASDGDAATSTSDPDASTGASHDADSLEDAAGSHDAGALDDGGNGSDAGGGNGSDAGGGNGSDAGGGTPDAGGGTPDAGGSADGGSDPPGGQCEAPCAGGMTTCDALCIPKDDPAYGCGTCTRCYANNSAANVLAATCSAGACAPAACRAGFADCDGNSANGCEADLGATTSCGGCGVVCGANQVCEGGTCKAACTFPNTNCNGACRDLATSPVACGACGNKCGAESATATCTAGQCGASTCVGGTSMCGGTCHDTSSDPTACGASCVVCSQALGSGGTPGVPPIGARYACMAGACAYACTGGYTNCAGSCVPLESDSANCGSCGNTCVGGQACIDGTCRASTSVRIVSGLTSPEDIAVDSQYLYVTDSGANTVLQIDKASLAQSAVATNMAKPLRVAVDTTHVYWTSNLGGAVLRAPIAGGNFEIVVSAQAPTAIALDDAHVIFAGGDGTYIAPKAAGTNAMKLASTVPISNAQSSDTYVLFGGSFYYFQSPGGSYLIGRVNPSNGTTSSFFYNNHHSWGLAATSDQLWMWQWAGFTGRMFTGYDANLLPTNTTAYSLLNPTANSAAPYAVVSDECALYFTDNSTGIWRYTPYTGWAVRITNQAVTSKHLAVDDTYVYWTDGGGFIGRVPK